MDNKKKTIKQSNPNEEIFCDYCDGKCTMSSLGSGNQLLEDNHSCVWKKWDYICLDCAEKLSDRIDEDEELAERIEWYTR